MATSTSSVSKKASTSSAGDSRRQVLKTHIEDCLKTYFSKTLGTVPQMVEIYLALLWYETRFGSNEISGKSSVGSVGQDYLDSTPVKQIRLSGTPEQKKNIQYGNYALGVGQVMGRSIVRGGSAKNGKCDIERLRPDLSAELCVNAGDDLVAALTGASNYRRAIKTGLVILEGKWNQCISTGQGSWKQSKTGKYTYPLRISAAVSAYLGNDNTTDANGTSPYTYASSIVGGSTYAIANGPSAPAIRDSQTQYAKVNGTGPTITVATGTTAKQPGCKKA